MNADHGGVALTRALLDLPAGSGELFPAEWETVRRRITIVHETAVPRETEPAGAPRLAGGDR